MALCIDILCCLVTAKGVFLNELTVPEHCLPLGKIVMGPLHALCVVSSTQIWVEWPNTAQFPTVYACSQA